MKLSKYFTAAIAPAMMLAASGSVLADTADDMMMRTLGTTENIGPVLTEAFNVAAQDLTEEQRELALRCWRESSCETGHGSLTVAYSDGFGENVWRQLTAMEFFIQAVQSPEVKTIKYSSARGDATKAISDIRSFIAQRVDIIVMFADASEALLPTVREATEAGIVVVAHNGTSPGGEPGVDYAVSISENLCDLGKAFVNVISENVSESTGIVELGGTPGNSLSATWQACSDEAIAELDNVFYVDKADTSWTQEGNFKAVSSLLAQHDDIGGYVYEYADGFRGALRAYADANVEPNFVAAFRTDEQGLFCDWEEIADPDFKIFYSSGQNYQSRVALTAALMIKAGEDVPPVIQIPFTMKPVTEGMCNTSLPPETSVSSLIDDTMLHAMFDN